MYRKVLVRHSLDTKRAVQRVFLLEGLDFKSAILSNFILLLSIRRA